MFLRNRERIIKGLQDAGHEGLINYMVQQVQQFDFQNEGFAMRYKLSDDPEEMRALEEELLTAILDRVPAERRLRGLPPSEIVDALSEEDAVRFRELLDRKLNRN